MSSDLSRLDEATDDDAARQIAEDPDDAPELTDEQLDKAEIWQGDKFIRRGRKGGSGVDTATPTMPRPRSLDDDLQEHRDP